MKSGRKSISEQVNKVPALHNFTKILRISSKFILDVKVANLVYVNIEQFVDLGLSTGQNPVIFHFEIYRAG